MQVLLFLHRLYFFVILNIRNKKTAEFNLQMQQNSD